MRGHARTLAHQVAVARWAPLWAGPETWAYCAIVALIPVVAALLTWRHGAAWGWLAWVGVLVADGWLAQQRSWVARRAFERTLFGRRHALAELHATVKHVIGSTDLQTHDLVYFSGRFVTSARAGAVPATSAWPPRCRPRPPCRVRSARSASRSNLDLRPADPAVRSNFARELHITSRLHARCASCRRRGPPALPARGAAPGPDQGGRGGGRLAGRRVAAEAARRPSSWRSGRRAAGAGRGRGGPRLRHRGGGAPSARPGPAPPAADGRWRVRHGQDQCATAAPTSPWRQPRWPPAPRCTRSRPTRAARRAPRPPPRPRSDRQLIVVNALSASRSAPVEPRPEGQVATAGRGLLTFGGASPTSWRRAETPPRGAACSTCASTPCRPTGRGRLKAEGTIVQIEAEPVRAVADACAEGHGDRAGAGLPSPSAPPWARPG